MWGCVCVCCNRHYSEKSLAQIYWVTLGGKGEGEKKHFHFWRVNGEEDDEEEGLAIGGESISRSKLIAWKPFSRGGDKVEEDVFGRDLHNGEEEMADGKLNFF